VLTLGLWRSGRLRWRRLGELAVTGAFMLATFAPVVMVYREVREQYGMRRNVGLDLKYGIGPAFTVSATINPDFGQVEADPSKVNLSGNELFPASGSCCCPPAAWRRLCGGAAAFPSVRSTSHQAWWLCCFRLGRRRPRGGDRCRSAASIGSCIRTRRASTACESPDVFRRWCI
jgi:hypothetical protein